MPRLSTLISVAFSRDIEIWKLTHPKILKFIEADNYTILVPEHEIKIFREATSNSFNIQPQEDFLDGYTKLDIEACLPEKLKCRAGWYMQQFAKLNAARRGDAQAINLIWDADTMPLKKLQFLEGDTLLFYSGTGIHKPYFETIKALLNQERIVDYSFMAMCFPTRKYWVDTMCASIEGRMKTNWIMAVLHVLPKRDQAEFSEYETLGTFISHQFADQIKFLNRTWEHNGYSVLADPNQLSSRDLRTISRKLDFVSFENYHKRRTDPQNQKDVNVRNFFRNLVLHSRFRNLAIRIKHKMA